MWHRDKDSEFFVVLVVGGISKSIWMKYTVVQKNVSLYAQKFADLWLVDCTKHKLSGWLIDLKGI